MPRHEGNTTKMRQPSRKARRRKAKAKAQAVEQKRRNRGGAFDSEYTRV